MKLPPTISIADYVEETQRLLKPPRVSRYRRLPFSRLDEPGPELEYLVDDLLTANEKSVVAGASLSGKSFFAIDLGMSLATGRPFFGHKVLMPGLVIYQAGEGALGIKKRLRAYRQHFDLDPNADIPFELLQAPIDLYHPEADTTPLIEEINWIKSEHSLPLRAVFIDTLATATGGADENSGKDMGTVMSNIDRIRRETGSHVCLVHHMNAAGLKLRGHTSIFANVDQVITVTLEEENGYKKRTAILSKQKDGEGGVAMRFELAQVKLGMRIDGKEITSCVCMHVGEKEAEKQARESGMADLKPGQLKIFKALNEAIHRQGRNPPADIRAPIWASCCTVTEWRDEMMRTAATPDEDQSALVARVKKARDRAEEMFLAKNLIAKDGIWIWRTKRRVFGLDRSSHPREAEPEQMPLDPELDEVTF
ncbi:MAG: hypothetical protein JWM36_3195 [Hyphomicrobiales bacterium]|nr:hypothetical protein [Hyphomicrobiales bacterium]